MSPRLTLVALASTLACAGGVDEAGGTRHNTPPAAALKAPVIAPMGRGVTLDASASADADGDPLSYVFELNDGSESFPTAEPVISHTFSSAGLFTVVVRVIDLHGDETRAAQDIAVRAEYPEVPDFCEASADCVVGDVCEGGVCYSLGGEID